MLTIKNEIYIWMWGAINSSKSYFRFRRYTWGIDYKRPFCQAGIADESKKFDNNDNKIKLFTNQLYKAMI